MDLMGRFRKRLSQGNQYILVAYHYNANHIRVLPFKNRRRAIITEAWEELHNDFKIAGVAV